MAKNALRASLEVTLPEDQTRLQWLRLFYILGDYTRGHSVFSKLMQMEKQGVTTVPFTTGRNKFDFITIDALAAQIGAVVSQDEINGIIHCCSGQPVAIREKIDEFISINNLSIRPLYGALPRPFLRFARNLGLQRKNPISFCGTIESRGTTEIVHRTVHRVHKEYAHITGPFETATIHTYRK
ncbi:hypothetical protein ACTMU2_39245 [Cupriavidus basilensis]